MKSAIRNRALRSVHVRRFLQCGTALPLALLVMPAQAQCVTEGDTATCTGDLSEGFGTGAANVIVSDLTSDITPPIGLSAIWMPDVASARIDTGDHTLDVQGAGAIVAESHNAVEVDFTGTIRVTGLNPETNSGAGIRVFANQGEGWDATVRSTGDIMVDISRDTASIQTHATHGIVADAGTAGIGSVTSTGDVSVRVSGEPDFILGIAASGGAGATVTNTGDVSISADGGVGSAVSAASEVDTVITSVGDIAVNFADGVGYGISANGARTSITSQGDITAGDGGIVARGQLLYDEEGNVLFENGIAEVTEINSVGNISTSNDGGPAILALGEEVTITSTGDLSTTGDTASGILAVRNFVYDREENEGTHDVSGRSVSVTSDGNITTLGMDSFGIAAAANQGDTSIVSSGDISTAGLEAHGIIASGQNVAIEATGSITTAGDGAHGITVVGMQMVDGDAEIVGGIAGDIAITGGSVSTSGLDAMGVQALSNNGDVSVTLDSVATSGDNGMGIHAQSTFGNVSVESGSVVASGSDTRAISILANNGIASLQAGDVTASGDGAFGALLVGREVHVTVDGSVQGTLVGIVAQSPFGLTEVLVNGSVVSTEGAGVVSTAMNGYVEIAGGASVTGSTAGVALLGGPEGGFTQFYNSGVVTGMAGPAVAGNTADPASTIVPDFYIQNNGTLIGGSNGIAVLTGAGNDTLELTDLSQITGIVDLGDGEDHLVLDFNDDAPLDALGKVASSLNVEWLSVDSGNWRADGTQSIYDVLEIEEDATLTVVENADGELAVEAAMVELEGALRLDLSVDETEGDLGETTMAGGGSLHLIGTATVELTDATGLQHTGGTFVENGELLLNTVYGGDIATSGDGVFELGEGGDFTGNLVNDGTFVVAREGDYDFLGDFSGSGLLKKQGDGTLIFAGLYAFTGTTSVLGGSVRFTGQLAEDTELDLSEGTIDLSQVEGGQQTVAQLSGESGALQLGETALTIQQIGDTVFSGSITGMGALIKEGEGDLKLGGDGTNFTGTGEVNGGTLSVNGLFENAGFEVNSGGTLGGSGTVGSTSVQGGTLAAGNSIGTLTVAGDLAFTADSALEVEVDPAGNADLIQVTGTATLGGAAVNVLAESGTYRPLTDYTILTADGGVSGTFGSVEANLAFLDPSLSYSANAVMLRLVRNGAGFASFAGTPNQGAIANLVESFGYGNTLYDAALTLIDEDVAPSFASLTGEVYPAYGAATIETAEMLRRQTREAMAAEGAYAWATGLYGNVSGDIELSGKGIAGGLGFGANGFSASAGLGLLDHDNGGGDFADGKVTFAIGRIAYRGLAGLSISAGAQFGWVDSETRRQTSLGTIDEMVTGSVEGDYLQFFGELGFSVPVGGLGLEPFVGISHVALEFDDLYESGAPTALAVSGIDREVTFGDIGVRLSGDADATVRPFASAAYRRAWGDRASLATVGFVGTTGSALVGTMPIAKGAAEFGAGLVVSSGPIDLEVGYDGTISKEFDGHGLNAGLKVRF